MSPPVISFLSDYGLADEFVGVCHGVIARRCPDAHVIDISHAVPAHDVRVGALLLRDAVPYMPAGVHLAIVDPAVGATGAHARRALALQARAEGHFLVGPDNGLLWPAAESLGGIAQALDVGASRERLQPVSATFHGRDVFAPVAAALAAGAAFASLGEVVAEHSVKRLPLPAARLEHGALVAHVLRVDRFGNLLLDATRAQLHEAGALPGTAASVERAGERHRARCEVAFAAVAAGELVVYVDSLAMAAIAVNLGSAAAQLGASTGDELTIRAG
jgi:S-adenosylmethionine hydrolase